MAPAPAAARAGAWPAILALPWKPPLPHTNHPVAVESYSGRSSAPSNLPACTMPGRGSRHGRGGAPLQTLHRRCLHAAHHDGGRRGVAPACCPRPARKRNLRCCLLLVALVQGLCVSQLEGLEWMNIRSRADVWATPQPCSTPMNHPPLMGRRLGAPTPGAGLTAATAL